MAGSGGLREGEAFGRGGRVCGGAAAGAHLRHAALLLDEEDAGCKEARTQRAQVHDAWLRLGLGFGFGFGGWWLPSAAAMLARARATSRCAPTLAASACLHSAAISPSPTW